MPHTFSSLLSSLLLLVVVVVNGWLIGNGRPGGRMLPRMNIFGDFFDSGKLKNQQPPAAPILPSMVCTHTYVHMRVYSPMHAVIHTLLYVLIHALIHTHTKVSKVPTTYVLNEKLFSLSGEDFTVKDVAGNKVIEIDGGNINIGGWVLDKLAFKDANGNKFCSVERRIVAATTCYDIYNTKGTCIAKIDREMITLTPKYKFYYEGDLNPFPDYYAEGSFLDRIYTFKSGNGEVIGKASKAIEAIRDVDRYQVDIAGGVDAAAILAMAVVIDEDQDEKDQQNRG